MDKVVLKSGDRELENFSALVMSHLRDSMPPPSGSAPSDDIQLFANDCTPEEMRNAIATTALVLKQYYQIDVNDSEFRSHLASIGLQSATEQDRLLAIFHKRKVEIIDLILAEHNSRTADLVENFDWDVRIVLGNSSIAAMRQHIASLRLHTMRNHKRNTRSIEMTKDKLDTLIEQLEECQKQLI